MSKNTDFEFYFGWLVDELKTASFLPENNYLLPNLKQCGVVYGTIKGILGQHMYAGNEESVEMQHTSTPAANKQNILHSFQSKGGSICLLITTIAFGMGVDCKGIHRIVHCEPSKTMEACVKKWDELEEMENKALHIFCTMGFS